MSVKRAISLDDWSWTIGLVTTTFGRAGELKVRYETDFPERFRALNEVCLRKPGAARLFKVEGVREHKEHALLKLEGVESISDAENWRNARVQVRREDAVPLPEGSYYVTDLIGMQVVTSAGRSLGKVENVLAYPAQDLLKIGDVLIPAVKEFIVSVDTSAGRIVVSPPEGLLPGEEMEHAD